MSGYMFFFLGFVRLEYKDSDCYLISSSYIFLLIVLWGLVIMEFIICLFLVGMWLFLLGWELGEVGECVLCEIICNGLG